MIAILVVVIDTSVWISGVFYRGNPFRVLQAWRDGKFQLVYTDETLAEIETRLRNKAVQFGADIADVEEWMSFIRAFVRMVPSTGAGKGATRDPKDDKFLDAAISGGAAYLVSSDRDLLILQEYQGVKIVSPREFLDILGSMR
ncbi:MAG: putative toxin-antitoxin system toxin component, PIN family [Chloroflexi bacterium]|nr:putative toxin-antitoxin system toxin component, PIN family [Chloroflexota bacterium]